MFRHRSFAVTALLLGVLAAWPTEAQDFRRGMLKKLDIENRTIVVTIDRMDHELTLTDDTQVPGAQGRNLAEKFRAFRIGNDVEFKTLAREGRQIVQGIRPAETNRGAQVRGGKGGDVPQKGKLKEVDVAGRTIALTVGDKDVVLSVTEQTDIRGTRGDTLAERLKSLEPGADVMFLAADRDGRKVLVRLTPAGVARGNANAGGRGGPGRIARPRLAKTAERTGHRHVSRLRRRPLPRRAERSPKGARSGRSEAGGPGPAA